MPSKRLVIALGTLLGLGAIASSIGLYQYQQYAATLPSATLLDDHAPAQVTVMYATDGEVIGEVYREWRYVIGIDQIPQHVQQVFIADEDADFLSHDGVDYPGIMRAAHANLIAGRPAQGASTITQQIARNLILKDRDKTIERKLKEIIVAWDIEETYSKDFILGLYINEVFLGAQSYGIEAAARSYFDKHVDALTASEAALLAGLPQRPSDYNPWRNPEAARARQHYVINQMVDKGFISEAEGPQAREEAWNLRRGENLFRSQAPHFTEHVRRLLVDLYGEDEVYTGSLQVHTTCDLALQAAAQDAISQQVADQDHKSGF